MIYARVDFRPEAKTFRPSPDSFPIAEVRFHSDWSDWRAFDALVVRRTTAIPVTPNQFIAWSRNG